MCCCHKDGHWLPRQTVGSVRCFDILRSEDQIQWFAIPPRWGWQEQSLLRLQLDKFDTCSTSSRRAWLQMQKCCEKMHWDSKDWWFQNGPSVEICIWVVSIMRRSCTMGNIGTEVSYQFNMRPYVCTNVGAVHVSTNTYWVPGLKILDFPLSQNVLETCVSLARNMFWFKTSYVSALQMELG